MEMCLRKKDLLSALFRSPLTHVYGDVFIHISYPYLLELIRSAWVLVAYYKTFQL